MKTNNTEMFENWPIYKAVSSLIIPTVISQLIHVLYNMADTFFIGRVGDPSQVAAASLAMPLFMVCIGLANLFGIGGSSLIARSLGVGDKDRVRKTSAFAIWTGAFVALAYGTLAMLFKNYLLPFIGTNESTYAYTENYMFWTVGLGALPMVMNTLLAQIVRAEGYSKQASVGIALGGILNIVLDPIFIHYMGKGVEGAAIATMVSNTVATLYFIFLFIKNRETLTITLNPKYYSAKEGIPKEVLLVGLPSAFLNILAIFSNINLNVLIADYSNEAMAGFGIAKKIDSLIFAVSNGISQGVLPIIGYNYSAKNYPRMKEAIRATLVIILTFSFAALFFLYVFAPGMIRVFIDEADTVYYGQLFQKRMCITAPFIAVTMMSLTLFQSVGKKVQPIILSLIRKGGIDIPLSQIKS